MNTAFIHKGISQTLQQVVESVMLSDWRTLSKEQILQHAARLRSIKAHYIATHVAHQLEIHQEVLGPLDQALLALYLLLDTLEGRDLAQQRDIYRALLEAQTPLLLACSSVPSGGSVQVSMDEQLLLLASDRSESKGQDTTLPALADASPALSQEEITTPPSEVEAPGRNTWFRWTEERERQLKKTITQSVGSLDRVDMAVIKQIAAQHNWPWHSVAYKVRKLQTQRSSREAQQKKEETAKEDD